MTALLVVALLQVTSPSLGALASPRPSACAPQPSGRLWARARSPGRAAWCVALARGYGALGSDLARAAAALERAERLAPERPENALLAARIAGRRGQWAQARALLREAQRAPERLRLDPGAALTLARAELMTGQLEAARAAYRQVAIDAALLPAGERSAAWVEAALALLTEGPTALEEASAYLSEAWRARGAPGTEGALVLARSLVLRLGGRASEAEAWLAEYPAARQGLSALGLEGLAAALPGGLGEALRQSGQAGTAARAAFSAALEAGGGPWAHHARPR